MSTSASDKFYITTPIFYVNAKPHIGHAFTCITADVLARYHRLGSTKPSGVGGMLRERTFLLTGTDEHGAKIAQAAERAGQTPADFTDEISQTFRELMAKLNISNDAFIRTTDREQHWPGVYKVWQTLQERGYLYKGTYQGLYCLGHEAFIKKSDLVDGLCPDHKTEPQVLEEENYFFKLSHFVPQLKKLYADNAITIHPASRANEVLNMLEDSEDVSFSRPREVVQWGIPVPGDESQLIYVWADALTNYISAIGYGRNDDYQQYWPADVQVIGKDILRFHAITWPAMLLALGLDVPKSLLVHGFITVDGQKMSKTLGNVIDPIALVDKYGLDPVRYFLMREISSSEDGDFSYKKLEYRYNADLANNLGNLVSRLAKLIETKTEGELIYDKRFVDTEIVSKLAAAHKAYESAMNQCRLHEALAIIWSSFDVANQYINDHKPWAEEHGDHLLTTLTSMMLLLLGATVWLLPFMPDTALKILNTFGIQESDLDRQSFSDSGSLITSWFTDTKWIVTPAAALFPRI